MLSQNPTHEQAKQAEDSSQANGDAALQKSLPYSDILDSSIPRRQAIEILPAREVRLRPVALRAIESSSSISALGSPRTSTMPSPPVETGSLARSTDTFANRRARDRIRERTSIRFSATETMTHEGSTNLVLQCIPKGVASTICVSSRNSNLGVAYVQEFPVMGLPLRHFS